MTASADALCSRCPYHDPCNEEGATCLAPVPTPKTAACYRAEPADNPCNACPDRARCFASDLPLCTS